MSKKTSSERLKALTLLLNENLISDQKMIVQLLKQKYGFEVNQAIISRDLRTLKAVKKEKNGQLYYEVSHLDINQEILKLAIRDIIHNEVMIVVHTHPGMADFVGDFLDKNVGMETIGCLSGENVVFIMPRSIHSIKKTFQIICKILNFKISVS